MKLFIPLVFTLFFVSCFSPPERKSNKAVFLSDISWTEAQKILTPDAVIVIPLGAAAKEHGPHLPLAADFIQAEGLAEMIAKERKVIIAPTVSYGYYPAFVKYPGSTTTYWTTSRDMILQAVRTLAGFGPRRFYIINIGVSTTPVLASAAAVLKDEGIVLYYSDYNRDNYEGTENGIRTSIYGGHADEMESSNILFFRGDLVDMSKAANDSSVKGKSGPMAPVPLEGGTYNPTGINGYAKLGSKQKGALYAKAFAKELLKDIDSVADCNLPVAKNRKEEYKIYEGTYTGANGRKLTIGQEGNHLSFIWNGIDQRNFFSLYNDGDDFFSAVPFNILFVRDSSGTVIKARCNYRGEVFWAEKDYVTPIAR